MAEEICAYSAYSEPGKPEAKDPSNGDLQPLVFRGHVAPVIAAHYWSLAHGGEGLRILLDDPAPLRSPLLPLAAELTLQVRLLLADSRDPGDPSGKRLSSLYPRYEEVAEKGNTGVDFDKVFAQMCKNCHGQNGVGGEIKEMEPVCVHDVAEEIGKGRPEPAIEEQWEEVVSFWAPLRSRSCGGEYLRARMRPRLRRPEEIVPLPRLLRGELGGKAARSFRSASSRCASVDFTAFAVAAFVAFPFPGFGGMAEAVGEIDGAGGGGDDGSGALLSFDFGSGGGRRRLLRLQQRMAKMEEMPLFPLLIKRDGADISAFQINNHPRSLP